MSEHTITFGLFEATAGKSQRCCGVWYAVTRPKSSQTLSIVMAMLRPHSFSNNKAKNVLTSSYSKATITVYTHGNMEESLSRHMAMLQHKLLHGTWKYCYKIIWILDLVTLQKHYPNTKQHWHKIIQTNRKQTLSWCHNASATEVN